MVFTRLIQWIFERNDVQMRVGKTILLAMLLNLVFGVGFFYAEGAGKTEAAPTLADSVWWAMVTMTTVGYGDFYPSSTAGRFLIAYPCFLFGIGLLGYLVGAVAEAVVDRASKRRKGLMPLRKGGHVLICNCPSVDKVLQLVAELRAHPSYAESGVGLVTDRFTELPEELKQAGVRFVHGTPTREDVLTRANVTGCEGVFVLAADPTDPGCDAQTFAAGAIIEMISAETGVPIKVVTELVNKKNQKMMERAGTDGMVCSDGIADCLLVQEYLFPGIHDIFQQIVSNQVGSQFHIFETRLEGLRVSDIQVAVLEHPTNMQVIGILKGGDPILNPAKTVTIEKGDRLIMLVDSRDDFHQIEEEILQKRAG